MIIIEHPETKETREIESNERFAPPWRAIGTVKGEKIEEERRTVTINVDDKLNKIAAMLFIPAADIAKVVGTALGINCPFCQLRFEIWKKAQELGWRKVVWLTIKSLRAQAKHDEAEIEAISRELEGTDQG